jgi:hypothetical protein
MSEEPDITAQGNHEYLITWQSEEETTESWVHITPGLLEELGVRTDEEQVVRRTAAFLADRQDAADMPAIIELEDVAASYDDYLAQLTRQDKPLEARQR